MPPAAGRSSGGARLDPAHTPGTHLPPAPMAINDPGLLSPAEAGLLIDRYELAMAASYLRRDMNEPAVFELFVRHLPPDRDWLLVAGLGPALGLVEAMRFGPDELRYLRGLGFERPFLDYLARFPVLR
jgi:nicotinic acid phosphoribosyltransferase